MEKKPYRKPEILFERDIEAVSGICLTGGANTIQDKLSGDPLCTTPMT